ncbi:large exoprotein [Microbacterium sp. LjRoot45]|uniref:large exoprotein n=1 Tax=Microbacterium sp. LjRoot45 TaxID=3342329 RepID=UPI003ED13EFA
MDGQVLGGGVIVLVAVVLWLVYLLPSWHGRYQYNAAERNAVRLNQALRVLAETAETPDEVRLELNARTALAQQKLARRAQAEREQLERDTARAEHEAAQARAAAEAALARQRMLAEREQALALAAAAAQDPATRRARARRRARLLITVVAVAALALAGWGVFEITRAGSPAALAAGAVVAAVAALMLQRMAAVQRRGLRRAAVVEVARPVASVQDVPLATERAAWTPRELPRPLTASAGSRASALLDAAAAQEALRHAAVDEAMRERAERDAPPSIDTARRTVASTPDFARMGYVDDAAIEEHVRSLLARRAVGA